MFKVTNMIIIIIIQVLICLPKCICGCINQTNGYRQYNLSWLWCRGGKYFRGGDLTQHCHNYNYL